MGLASIMVQETVPDALRGRVMSIYSLTFTGVMSFASLLISSTVDWMGMRWELQFSAGLYALGALVLVWRLRREEREGVGGDGRWRELARSSPVAADD